MSVRTSISKHFLRQWSMVFGHDRFQVSEGGWHEPNSPVRLLVAFVRGKITIHLKEGS